MAIGKQILVSLAIRPISVLLGFLSTVLFARELGAADFGKYSFVIAILVVISIPIQSAIPTLIVRQVAKDKSSRRKIRYWAVGLSLKYSLFAAALLVVAGLFYNNGKDLDIFYYAIMTLPFLAVAMIASAEMRGLGFVVIGQLADVIFRPGFLLLFSWVWILLFGYLSAEKLMLFYVATALVVFVFGLSLFYLSNKEALSFEYKSVSGEKNKWLKSVFPLSLLAGFQIINTQLDMVILGFIESDVNTGIYKVSLQLSLLLGVIIAAVNQALHPRLSSYYHHKKNDQLRQLIENSSAFIFVATLLPAIFVFSLGNKILLNLFGDIYLLGYESLIILMCGQLLNASFGSVGAILNMSGYEKYTIIGMGAALLTNIGLNIALVPWLGIIGAAIATSFSYFVWNIILWRFVKAKIGIEPAGFINIFMILGRLR